MNIKFLFGAALIVLFGYFAMFAANPFFENKGYHSDAPAAALENMARRMRLREERCVRVLNTVAQCFNSQDGFFIVLFGPPPKFRTSLSYYNKGIERQEVFDTFIRVVHYPPLANQVIYPPLHSSSMATMEAWYQTLQKEGEMNLLVEQRSFF